MKKFWSSGLKKSTFLAFLIVSLVAAGNVAAQISPASELSAAVLLEKHAALSEALSKNQYRRPLFLESMENSGRVSSTVYAVLASPFSTVSATLKKPSLWCEILILHLNTKYCHANADISPSILEVNIGKKTPQSLPETFLLDFSYRVLTASTNYLAVQLHADKGPLSTSDYRIELQAVPLAEGKTFMYLRYSYSYGLAGRLAMQTYLVTLGRGKIGFTQIAQTAQDQKPGYVGGMRGAVERNTMRYYLAIESYLASLKQAPEHQLNTRLQHWFDATEEYAEQLHEVDKTSYLAMKKDEYQRQQAIAPKAD